MLLIQPTALIDNLLIWLIKFISLYSASNKFLMIILIS